jgi:hypothetical protein
VAKKIKKTPDKIDPNKIKTRDLLLLALLRGATKAGIQKDRKKEASRKAARKRVDPVEE